MNQKQMIERIHELMTENMKLWEYIKFIQEHYNVPNFHTWDIYGPNQVLKRTRLQSDNEPEMEE